MWCFFPDTKGLPLEEIAAIFGDADEVAIYQREIEIDHNTHAIVDHHGGIGYDKPSESTIEKTEVVDLGGVQNEKHV